jgi:hypothetical protein
VIGPLSLPEVFFAALAIPERAKLLPPVYRQFGFFASIEEPLGLGFRF